MSTPPSPTFKCRTITAFIHLTPSDVPDERLGGKLEEDKEYVDLESGIYRKIKEASEGLQKVRGGDERQEERRTGGTKRRPNAQ